MKISHLLLTVIIALCFIGCTHNDNNSVIATEDDNEESDPTYEMEAWLEMAKYEYTINENIEIFVVLEVNSSEDVTDTIHILLESSFDGVTYDIEFDDDHLVTVSSGGDLRIPFIVQAPSIPPEKDGKFYFRVTMTSDNDTTPDDNSDGEYVDIILSSPGIIAPVGNN